MLNKQFGTAICILISIHQSQYRIRRDLLHATESIHLMDFHVRILSPNRTPMLCSVVPNWGSTTAIYQFDINAIQR